MAHANVSAGLTVYKSLDLDESEEEVVARPCSVYNIHAVNVNAAARYLKLYNATASGTTVGTTVPLATFYLPASGANPLQFNSTHGLRFNVALCIAATTGFADNDVGSPSANDVFITLSYA